MLFLRWIKSLSMRHVATFLALLRNWTCLWQAMRCSVKAGREYSQHNGIIIRNTGGEHTLLADLVLVACQDLLVLFS
jgi:hypothetical protein